MAEPSAQENVEMKENASGLAQSIEGSDEVEDWDKTRDGPDANTSAQSNSEKVASGDGQYKSFGRANGRGLAQLMSPHAPKGKELILSEEEEARLATELGKWINTDTNPYEGQEDSYFKAQASE